MPRLSKIGAAALAAFGWTSGSTVTATYLQVAGGGGGGFVAGGNRGAGGGAGGLLTGTTTLNPTQSYTVVVGAGGSPLANGSNSQFGTLTASVGGGAGGSQNGASSIVGQNGGSGGGGVSQSGSGSNAAGSGTSGQGNAGAAGTNAGGQPYGQGGGGGAGAAGSLSNNPAGAGGIGLTSSITGTSVYYAGGGGGGSYSGSSGVGGSGGSGGGGTGGGTNGVSTSGTANLGGGGGGAEYSQTAGSSGGSGVVIISYPSPQKFGGGIVTTSGANTIHTFQTSGTLSPLSTLSASYLIVAGGGSGGGGGDANGGGGAGGLLTGSGLTIDTNSIYVVTVGAGGSITSSGSSSRFSAFATTAVGGGAGANRNTTVAASGGSGGGGSEGSAPYPTAGTGTSGQGNSGGNGDSNEGGGGGGAGAVGGAGVGNTSPGNGGVGIASSISGTSTYYAGGGGGGNNFTSAVASGGLGGGGKGAVYIPVTNATAGTANTGGGGGGNASGVANTAGAGGSGIVIISYAGSVQQMAGGTVTISGGNVIHTFTSSGYLTPLKLVNNSLRFRSSASAYLNRTPTVASNRTTWTWSAWVKRGSSSFNTLFAARQPAPRQYIAFYNNQIYTYGTSSGTDFVECGTTAVFRDFAAWYHIVYVYDTTQATGSNRVKVYVNGVQQTLTFTTTPSQNSNGAINGNWLHYLGSQDSTTPDLDAYLSEVNFIDGQALTPNSFGTFNSYGVWQPITYGGSYGTNGFYLPFTNKTSTTTLGYDFSPAGNNWTTNNISLTAGSTYDSMTDVPTLTSTTAANYCTLNPISNPNGTIVTYSNGNLAYSNSASSGNAPKMTVQGTMAFTAGKFYWEYTVGSIANDQIGIGTMLVFGGSADGTAGARYLNGGTFQSSYTTPSAGASYTTGDIIGVAYDQPNGTLAFYKNNSLQGTVTAISTTEVFFPMRSPNSSGTGGAGSFNFGQQPWIYTPPTGFLALNTYNL